MSRLLPRRVPVVYQIEAAECGAASLCMILGYHGRYEELGVMRGECRISRDGSRLSYLMAAAKKYGLSAKAFRKDAKLEGIVLPAIVFWRFNHFLVVERMSDKYVWLCDPARGRRKISAKEFAEGYSGVVLQLEKTDSFEPGGKPYHTSSYLFRMVGERKGTFLFLSILLVALNLAGLVIPALLRLFVDYYLPASQRADISSFALIFSLVLLLQFAMMLLRKRVILRFQKVQSKVMAGATTKKMLYLPLSYFQTRSHSGIVSRLGAIDSLAEFFTAQIVPMTMGLLFSLLYMVVLFRYSRHLFAAVILVDAGIVLLLLLMIKWNARAAAHAVGEQIRFFGEISQNMHLFDTIKATAMEEFALVKTMDAYSRYVNALQESRFCSALTQAIPWAVPLLIQTIVVCIGSGLVIQGRLTVGGILACQSIAVSIFSPVADFVVRFNSLQGQDVNVHGLRDIEMEEVDPMAVRTGRSADEARGEKKKFEEVELRHVSFGYNPLLPPVVKDVSLRIPRGESVAIVGKSGSGKSTILKLIEGILLPNDGEVLLDGIPLIKTDREDFSSSVAIVSQEPHLMRGTVEQNIVFSNPDIGIMDVRRAAEAACIREDIEKHPGGFETMIDPSNSEFSGGQVQRLMIARALAIKPSILILDEATSALDTLIEEEIMENIRKLGITTIIVAHRLSSIRDCDTIYVVDQGSIVEQGSHDELMADQNSLYYSLVATGGAETK